MAFAFMLPLRVMQAVFTIIVLGLSSYVVDWWRHYWHNSSPSEINFLIFASSWTILALTYLIIVPWRMSNSVVGHKFGILAAEMLTMIFWFAGFIALAVFLGNRVCFGTVCSCAKAACVFASLNWLFFAGTTVLSVMHVVRTRGTSPSPREKPPMQMPAVAGPTVGA